MNKNKFPILLAAIFLISALATISFCASSLTKGPEQPPIDAAAVAPAEALGKAFEAVAAHVKPAVVSVFSEKILKFRSSEGAMPGGDLFDFFFGDEPPGLPGFGGRPGPPQQEFRIPIRGMGSGMILDREGRILTNYHVVRGFDEIKVQLADRTNYPAKVVGVDARSDVAVIRISGRVPASLPTVALGDSERLKVGDLVLAIGAPFGLPQTVTQGMISATGRSHVGISDFEDFIQTDAAINPGNSGGPLVNMKGEVVGINSAIATSVGQFAGVGFSIPSNLVKSMLPKLFKGEKVERGILGVVIQDLNEELADQFGLKQSMGVLVAEVKNGSAADKAGLKSGDIIVKYDDKRVNDAGQLRNLVAATAPSTRVKIDVIRKGSEKEFTAEVESMDAKRALASTAEMAEQKYGFAAMDIPRELKNQYQLKHGALVSDVMPGSPASFAGLEPEDIIVQADHKDVDDVKDLRRILDEAKDKSSILMLLRRQDASLFVVLRTQ